MQLTPRDFELIETLTCGVPFLTTPQIADGWWPSVRSLNVVKRRLRGLVTCELLDAVDINVLPAEACLGPALVIDSNATPLPFDSVAGILTSLAVSAAQPTRVWISGRRAHNLLAETRSPWLNVSLRDRAARLVAAFVFHHRRGMTCQQWQRRTHGDDLSLRNAPYDAVIQPASGEHAAPSCPIAVCCRPISLRRWQRLMQWHAQQRCAVEVW